MAIPYNEQYFYESDRNNKYAWLAFGLVLLSLFVYGILFHWIQYWLRYTRKRYRAYFLFQRTWTVLNGSIKVPLPGKRSPIYFQPSLLLFLAVFVGINVAFCFAQTADLDYQPHRYIVGKRIGKVATGSLPILYLFATKNDTITFITGIPHDKLNFIHRWIGRVVFAMIIAHLTIAIKYWLDLDFKIMIEIPPQIFGMIAFGSMCILNLASPRIIRRLSYEFFLFNHGLFAGIMMLFALFHNPAARAHVILAIHIVVLDRVISFARAAINKYLSPTKGLADFTILDSEGTVEVRLPLAETAYQRWWLPRFGTWTAGQHGYLRVASVRKIQWHPFTIASLSETGEIRLVIRAYSGFTKGLGKKITALQEVESTKTVQMKAMLHGPYGGKHQPLMTFESLLFFSGGTGSSFTFPVALDLIKRIHARNLANDFAHRPSHCRIRIVWFLAKKEHLVWYKDTLQEFQSYSKHMDVSIECYITRESPEREESKTVEVIEKCIEVDSSNIEFDPTSIINFGKPDAADILAEEVSRLNKRSESLAVLGCGPAALVDHVAHNCQSHRQKGYDVYTYVEKYVV
ncbi:hypothetical protein TRVA0_011S00232 [Trichomonascus vanleenenianus]|uniref:ferric reductase family protein n=1 Tax=Trichomonascus vanleenenianus TaxID=2268995 RepID=UPI003ECB240F